MRRFHFLALDPIRHCSRSTPCSIGSNIGHGSRSVSTSHKSSPGLARASALPVFDTDSLGFKLGGRRVACHKRQEFWSASGLDVE